MSNNSVYTYSIIRYTYRWFRRGETRDRVLIRTGLTWAERNAYFRDQRTRGFGWFDVSTREWYKP